MLVENMDLQDYELREENMELGRAVRFSYLVTLAAAVLYTAVYLLRYSYYNIFATVFKPTFLLEFFILMLFAFLFMAAGLIAKAAILAHACENSWQGVKFKIVRGLEKPYCAAVEPLTVRQYMLGIAAYILIAALVPYIIAFFVGDYIFVLASFISVVWVSGDIILLLKLSKKNRGDYIVDIDCVMYYKIYGKK